MHRSRVCFVFAFGVCIKKFMQGVVASFLRRLVMLFDRGMQGMGSMCGMERRGWGRSHATPIQRVSILVRMIRLVLTLRLDDVKKG